MLAEDIRSALRVISGGAEPTLEHQEVFIQDFMEPLLDGDPLTSNGFKKKIPPHQWSVRALFEALVLDGQTVPGIDFATPAGIQSTQFPMAIGNLMKRTINKKLQDAAFIGDKLVTVLPSSSQSETLYWVNALQGLKRVEEGNEYEASSFGDDYATTRTEKRGRKILLTKEMIYFDKTGLILQQAQQIGETAGRDKENRIIRSVMGLDGQCYKPKGVATPLYSGALSNITTHAPLVSPDDVASVLLYHQKNFHTEVQDEDGTPLVWVPKYILVSPDKHQAVSRMFGATKFISKDIATNMDMEWNDSSPPYAVLTTPLWPAAVSVDRWYFGDFAGQFVWHENWPISVETIGADSQLSFDRDIVMQARVSYMGDISAWRADLVLRNG